MIGVIYRVTNQVNGKVYIGQTTVKLSDRWTRHKHPKSGCLRLRNAIAKHGADNFVCEEIQTCAKEDLDTVETALIAEYDSIRTGYNIMAGGQGTRIWTDEMRTALSLKMTGRKLSPEHAARNRGVTAPFYGRKHTDESLALMRQNNRQVNKMEVDQFTLDGTFVKRHESLTLAAKEVSVKHYTISAACFRENGSCQGFRWKWVVPHKPPAQRDATRKQGNAFRGKHHTDATKLSLRQKSKSPGFLVDQFTLQGVFVKRWDSLREAADSVNVHVTGVRKVCNGECKYSKGYLWKWVKPAEDRA